MNGGGLFGAASNWLGKAQEQAFSYIAPEQKGPQQLFEQAVMDGNRGEVHHFLASGQSPHQRTSSGNAMVHVAAYHGHADVVHALIQAGADMRAVGSGGNPCLHYAAAGGSLDLVKF